MILRWSGQVRQELDDAIDGEVGIHIQVVVWWPAIGAVPDEDGAHAQARRFGDVVLRSVADEQDMVCIGEASIADVYEGMFVHAGMGLADAQIAGERYGVQRSPEAQVFELTAAPMRGRGHVADQSDAVAAFAKGMKRTVGTLDDREASDPRGPVGLSELAEYGVGYIWKALLGQPPREDGLQDNLLTFGVQLGLGAGFEEEADERAGVLSGQRQAVVTSSGEDCGQAFLPGGLFAVDRAEGSSPVAQDVADVGEQGCHSSAPLRVRIGWMIVGIGRAAQRMG